MNDADTTRTNALQRLNLHQINAFAPTRNIDIQLITITQRLIDLLTEHVVNRHLGHTFGFHLKALAGGIGEDVDSDVSLFRDTI